MVQESYEANLNFLIEKFNLLSKRDYCFESINKILILLSKQKTTGITLTIN